VSSSLRIVVTGIIAQHPLIGGITWHYLQYLLGLDRLGHDVYYLEDSGEVPYNLDGGVSGSDYVADSCECNVSYLASIMGRFGLEDRWAYRCASDSRWYGLSDQRRAEMVRSADLLINVSGTLEHPDQYSQIPLLVYVDTDPVVTQIKIALDTPEFVRRVRAHDTWFSFGESISKPIPESGHRWRPTRQPVVLSEWRPSAPRRESFTTVMNWTSYPPLVYAGRTYGQKDVEFKRFLGLPGRVPNVPMEVALSRTEHRNWQSDDGDLPPELMSSEKTSWKPRDLISRAGWHVVDAIDVGGDLDLYRHYIESSKAEWSVAKNAYVLGMPGWFSERSACYLASGRPVIVQDTGFGTALPVGDGILSFQTLEEAAAAIEDVETRYSRHANAARAIAETYFDSDKVLTRLIDEAAGGARRRAESGTQIVA
jgi:hypothetical protein